MIGLPLEIKGYSMMLSIRFAPDTPEWLFITVLILSLGTGIVLLIWAMILEIRYKSPFAINKASDKEKWRRATILALMQTAMIPILGLAQPTLSPNPGQWPIFPLFCGGVWIVALPVAILFKRWEFDRQIKSYQYFDKMIKDKNSFYHRIFANPFTSLARIFMTSEQKRFFSEGFPESIDNKKDGVISEQENISTKKEPP
jgi:hypothetical protein